MIVGGNYESNLVAQFKNNEWLQFDHLKQGRQYHGSITIKEKTMILGGKTQAE